MPLLHREAADRLAGVLDDVADTAVDADLADRAEDHVLGRQTGRQVAGELEQHRLRAALGQRLRREHVLDLGGADPERERAEGAVRRRVAVAADDRLAGLREPELGPDHVDDSLAARARRVELDPELVAVARAARRAGPGPSRRRSARGSSARCGPSSRRSARAGARGGPRGAAPRTPAAR